MDPAALARALADAAAGPAGGGAAGASLRRAGGARRRSSTSPAPHGLRLIEDCAQSHGALIAGGRPASFGDIGCFSFYPTKNLGALGDGGIVVTDDAGLAAAAREIREYGWRDRYVSAVRRHQHPARPDPGGDPRRQARRARAPTMRAARRSPARYDAGLAGPAAHAAARARRRHPCLPPIRDPHRRSATGCASICAPTGSAPAFTTRCRCICSRPIAAASPPARSACARAKRSPAKSSACRSIRSSPTPPSTGSSPRSGGSF